MGKYVMMYWSSLILGPKFAEAIAEEPDVFVLVGYVQ